MQCQWVMIRRPNVLVCVFKCCVERCSLWYPTGWPVLEDDDPHTIARNELVESEQLASSSSWGVSKNSAFVVPACQ